MIQNEILYRRESGAVIRYASGEGENILAYIQDEDGIDYDVKSLDVLLARGYWESVKPLEQ